MTMRTAYTHLTTLITEMCKFVGEELRETRARGLARQEAGFTQFRTQNYTLLSTGVDESKGVW